MPSLTFTPHVILFGAGLAAVLVAFIYMLAARQTVGNATLAAALSGGFAAYTAVTIASEGFTPVLLNHTSNLWGIQVWWDLLFSLGIATFFVLPRARAQNMHIAPWLVFIAASASIGLLPMVARLFWLERQAGAKS